LKGGACQLAALQFAVTFRWWLIIQIINGMWMEAWGISWIYWEIKEISSDTEGSVFFNNCRYFSIKWKLLGAPIIIGTRFNWKGEKNYSGKRGEKPVFVIL
jgi:hypothetical protein